MILFGNKFVPFGAYWRARAGFKSGAVTDWSPEIWGANP